MLKLIFLKKEKSIGNGLILKPNETVVAGIPFRTTILLAKIL
jgi:hypothetical protein